MTATMAARDYPLTMSEQALMDAVIALALRLGWLAYHVTDSRKDIAGFPDLVLVPPVDGPAAAPFGQVSLAEWRKAGALFVELKTTKGKLRPEQRVWLDRLAKTGAKTAIWRPADWADGTIERVLHGNK